MRRIWCRRFAAEALQKETTTELPQSETLNTSPLLAYTSPRANKFIVKENVTAASVETLPLQDRLHLLEPVSSYSGTRRLPVIPRSSLLLSREEALLWPAGSLGARAAVLIEKGYESAMNVQEPCDIDYINKKGPPILTKEEEKVNIALGNLAAVSACGTEGVIQLLTHVSYKSQFAPSQERLSALGEQVARYWILKQQLKVLQSMSEDKHASLTEMKVENDLETALEAASKSYHSKESLHSFIKDNDSILEVPSSAMSSGKEASVFIQARDALATAKNAGQLADLVTAPTAYAPLPFKASPGQEEAHRFMQRQIAEMSSQSAAASERRVITPELMQQHGNQLLSVPRLAQIATSLNLHLAVRWQGDLVKDRIPLRILATTCLAAFGAIYQFHGPVMMDRFLAQCFGSVTLQSLLSAAQEMNQFINESNETQSGDKMKEK